MKEMLRDLPLADFLRTKPRSHVIEDALRLHQCIEAILEENTLVEASVLEELVGLRLSFFIQQFLISSAFK